MRKYALTFVALVCFSAYSYAETKFLKVNRDQDGVPKTVETATVTYQKGNVTVDLISVIHVGDLGYYKGLDKQFQQYESLLYELVAPKGVVPEKKKVGSLDIQMLIGLLLHLSHQTNSINYKAKNFVHADLSPQEMAKAIKARGHDTFTLIASIALDLLKQYNLGKFNNNADPRKLAKLRHKDQAVYFKRIMADTMEDSANAGGMGRTIESILIDDRNKAAMKVLKSQVNLGRRKLGLFYGAAHMPDFEKRLLILGFKKTGTTWQKAWDIRPKGPEFMLQMMMENFQQ